MVSLVLFFAMWENGSDLEKNTVFLFLTVGGSWA